MNSRNLLRLWSTHLAVAFWVGIVLGTIVGLYEGASVLLTEDLVGRYNELVAWAIAFDASAVVAVEFFFAFLSALIFTAERRPVIPFRLVALQIGESVFGLVFAVGAWNNGMADPLSPVTNPAGLIGLPLLVGALAGAVALLLSRWTLERIPLIRRLSPRYWLVAEAAVVVGAILFGFSH